MVISAYSSSKDMLHDEEKGDFFIGTNSVQAA